MPLQLLGISRSADIRQQQPRQQPRRPCSARCPIRGCAWLIHGPLAAAVSVGQLTPLEHAALLAEIHRHADVLPMRFGGALPDEQAVCDLLRRRHDAILAELDRLSGTGEIGLRIELCPSPHEPAPVVCVGPPMPGDSPEQYLAARRALYRRQDQAHRHAQLAAERCMRAVEGFYRDWRRLSPEPPGTLRLALLVERTLFRTLLDRLATFKAETTGWQSTILGPWPPYSFVQGSG
ncbi:MAG: GvpL/GvpF family gas vesicle protein [Thermoguttaceae bacterium]